MEGEAYVGSRALPTFLNFCTNVIEVTFSKLFSKTHIYLFIFFQGYKFFIFFFSAAFLRFSACSFKQKETSDHSS